LCEISNIALDKGLPVNNYYQYLKSNCSPLFDLARLAKIAQFSDNRAMPRFVMPTCAEIHVAYWQGEEAVIALFAQTLGQLATCVQALEDQTAKNNHNNSQPPSSDGLDRLQRYKPAVLAFMKVGPSIHLYTVCPRSNYVANLLRVSWYSGYSHPNRD
jgi:hypothetical protein